MLSVGPAAPGEMEIDDDISIERNVPFRQRRRDAGVACGISYDFFGHLVF